jgi:hypothetical protein
VSKALGGRNADDFQRKFERFDPEWFGHQVFGDGGLALLSVTAVLLGALLIPNPRARLTTGVLSIFVGITYIPGFTRLSFDAIGLGPTLWRVSWVAPVAALVGVVATRFNQRSTGSALRVVGPLGLVVALVAVGHPIGTRWTTLQAPFHYQRLPETVQMAERVMRRDQPGDLVLAPWPLSISITVLTTRIHSVAPRTYVMDYLRNDPRFHFRQRLALNRFVSGDARWHRRVIGRDLQVVGVDTVCLNAGETARLRAIWNLGYRQVDQSSAYTCLTR